MEPSKLDTGNQSDPSSSGEFGEPLVKDIEVDRNEEALETDSDLEARCRGLIAAVYEKANALALAELTGGNDGEQMSQIGANLPEFLRLAAENMGSIRHAVRGATLTLALYKAVQPSQDIRAFKQVFAGGFSARSYDNKVTVPFLAGENLPYNRESHWLSQTLSFGSEPYSRSTNYVTAPREAWPTYMEIVNGLEELGEDLETTRQYSESIATLVMKGLIVERNRSRVVLTRPKNQTIAEVLSLLEQHFTQRYSKNAPRLPQLAMFAIYQCLVASVGRYKEFELKPLERMKAADKKARTVGDVVLARNGVNVEAAEIKLGVAVSQETIATAIDKIRGASVERYYVLSTAGIVEPDKAEIRRMCAQFRKSNGCEIIVNGVEQTIGYYLRLLVSTGEFVERYVELVSSDPDLDYQHREAWNLICASE